MRPGGLATRRGPAEDPAGATTQMGNSNPAQRISDPHVALIEINILPPQPVTLPLPQAHQHRNKPRSGLAPTLGLSRTLKVVPYAYSGKPPIPGCSTE
jgi:hypothetical protein